MYIKDSSYSYWPLVLEPQRLLWHHYMQLHRSGVKKNLSGSKDLRSVAVQEESCCDGNIKCNNACILKIITLDH